MLTKNYESPEGNVCQTIQEFNFESVDLLSIQVSLSVRSIFIGCLAVSDLLMSLTSLPVTAVTTFTRAWIFPSFFCKLIGVFQGGSIFVSSFTLTVIAIDRCVFVKKPNQELSFMIALSVVTLIWCLGYLLAMPVGIFSKSTSFADICGTFCEEEWPDADEEGRSNVRRLYGITVLLLQFGIPTVISSFCYWMISRVMSCQLEKRRGQKLLPDKETQLVSRKTRANRMMISMVGGFVLAWMPLNAVNLYRDFFDAQSSPWFSTVFALCHVIAMTSAVWNPIIYSWFNPQFRTAIKGIWDAQRRKRSANEFNTEVLPLKSEIRLRRDCTPLPSDNLL